MSRKTPYGGSITGTYVLHGNGKKAQLGSHKYIDQTVFNGCLTTAKQCNGPIPMTPLLQFNKFWIIGVSCSCYHGHTATVGKLHFCHKHFPLKHRWVCQNPKNIKKCFFFLLNVSYTLMHRIYLIYIWYISNTQV